MNPLASRAVAVARLDDLSRASRQQRLLRLLAGAGAVLFPVLATAAGSGWPGVGAWLVVAVGLTVVVLPDSHAPLVWTLLAAALWTLSVPAVVSAWTLAAAADLVVVHLACALACYGPATLTLPAVLVRLWARRAATMLAVTVLVWLAARVVTTLDPPSSPWLFGAALAAVAGWAAYLLPRLLARDGAEAVGRRS